MPKKERDLRQKSDPNAPQISNDEMNRRLDAILGGGTTKVKNRLQMLQMEASSMAKQLDSAMKKKDEKRTKELTENADRVTKEYMVLLGYAMDETGKLDPKKLEDELDPAAISLNIQKAEKNSVMNWLKADGNPERAKNTLQSIGDRDGEQFARDVTNTYVRDMEHQQKVDAEVDKVLKNMGFDPAALRKQSQQAWKEMKEDPNFRLGDNGKNPEQPGQLRL